MSWGIFTRLGATVAAGLVLVGCDSIRGSQEPITTSADLVNGAKGCMSDDIVLRQYNKKAWGDVADPKKPDGTKETDPTKTCPIGTASQREYRDMVIGYRLTAYNHRFREFSTELREAKVGIGLGAELLDAALDFAGAVFGSAGTKSILSAASGAANAGRNSVDVNVFYKQTLPAIVAKMEATRDTIILNIREKQQKSESEYPIDAALDDLTRVERSSSIERAIAAITEKTKTEADAADEKIREFKITRPLEMQEYLLSEPGRKRTAEFRAAYAKLNAEQAVLLGITKPAVENAKADKDIKDKFGSIDFSKLDATAKDNAYTAINMRWRAAQSQDELAKWEAAVNALVEKK